MGEDEATTRALLGRGDATHAVAVGTRLGAAPALSGLAPVPNVVGVVKGGPHADQARTLLDWLSGPDAANIVEQQGSLSPWRPSAALTALAAAAPPLDVDWTFEAYRAARSEWGRKPYAHG
jgi:hypothetical protein